LGKVDDTKALREYLTKSGVYTGTIYGVRRGDIEAVKAMPNWVPLDTLVETKLAALNTSHVMGMVKQAIGFDSAFHWRLKDQVPATSPYMTFAAIFKDVKEADGVATSNLQALCRLYKVTGTATMEPTALIVDYQSKKDAIMARYPLLSAVSRYSVETKDIAEYINMVDTVKPV
jgi:hypothetical protein